MNKEWIKIIAYNCYKLGIYNGTLNEFQKLFEEQYKKAGGKK